MNDQQQIEALQRRIAALEARLAPEPAPPVPTEELRSSRRGLLKLAGAAVAGAAASSVIAAAPAAATDGDAVTLGQWKTATTNRTRTDYTGGLSGGQAFLFQAGNTQDGNAGFVSAALAGWTTVAGMPNGIYGYSSLPDGKGIYGRADGTGFTAGVHGLASAIDGAGVLAESTGLFGAAVVASAEGAAGAGVRATSSGENGIAVLAVGNLIGVSATGRHGVDAEGTRFGMSVRGNQSAMYVTPSDNAPPSRSGLFRVKGELTVDSTGALWFCVGVGDPGTWQKLGGPGTSGSFHPITPSRVHDSRKPTANPITSSSGPRLVNVANKINSTGHIELADIVPAGATAIAYNLTIVNTIGTNGYLAVNPGGTNTVSASAINWSAPNLTLANGSVVTISTNRQVTVICGGSSTSTNFIIDVVGYYR